MHIYIIQKTKTKKKLGHRRILEEKYNWTYLTLMQNNHTCPTSRKRERMRDREKEKERGMWILTSTLYK